jgi:glucose/mannose transport system permease protein
MTGDARPDGGRVTTRLPDVSSVRESISVTADRVVLYGILTVLVVLFFLPLETGIMTSFKTQSGYLSTLPFTPPDPNNFSPAPWRTAWAALSQSLVNSVLFTVPATILSALIGSLAAHGLANAEWRGRNVVFFLFAIGIFLPYESTLIPLSRFFNWFNIQTLLANLGPINVWSLPLVQRHHSHLIELVLTHTVFGIPITTLLFRGYYQTLSDDLFDAAVLDGAGLWTIYRELVLPMSKPMFVVTFIYQFTSIWNSLLFALILVGTNDAAWPATIAINQLAQEGYVPTYNTMMAGAFIVAAPTVLLYLVFGKHLAEGIAGYGQMSR